MANASGKTQRFQNWERSGEVRSPAPLLETEVITE
nr:MAG TPA: hypothetical protein [Caudoviricetes sp.]